MQIEEARNEMRSPVFNPIVAIAAEPKFWCHFCVREVPRVVDFDGIQVLNLGIISHIARFVRIFKTISHKRQTPWYPIMQLARCMLLALKSRYGVL